MGEARTAVLLLCPPNQPCSGVSSPSCGLTALSHPFPRPITLQLILNGGVLYGIHFEMPNGQRVWSVRMETEDQILVFRDMSGPSENRYAFPKGKSGNFRRLLQ